LAEALAGSTSSAHSDSKDDKELLRMFGGSERAPSVTDVNDEQAPRQNTDYQGTDYGHDEAGETWFQPESAVERLQNLHDNRSSQNHQYGEPEGGLGSLDVVPEGSALSYAMLPQENLPLAYPDAHDPEQGYSPALSSMESAESNAALEPGVQQNTENQALDIFGTDAEHARQLLYGRR
jgi:hypothetical protein